MKKKSKIKAMGKIIIFVGDTKYSSIMKCRYPLFNWGQAINLSKDINKYFDLKKRYRKADMSKCVIFCLPTYPEIVGYPHVEIKKPTKKKTVYHS